ESTGSELDAVREASMLTGDIGLTAVLARQKALHEAVMKPLQPIKVMLAAPEPDAESVWQRFHPDPGEKATVWIEDKFDGIRAQLHKVGGRVEIFSRDLRPITTQFGELAQHALGFDHDLVVDGEIVAFEEGRKLTFFDLQKRLGRKGGDLFLGNEIPVVLVAFDLLWIDGRNLLKEPLHERRRQLDLLRFPPSIRPAGLTEATSPTEIEEAFRAARSRGNEGLLIKDPQSSYTPGRRGHSWIKLKKELATLDVVVVAVEAGHGKRRGMLSDYTFAVRDEASGELVEIGKAYSGLTDAEIHELTEHFDLHTLERKGSWQRVEPNVVLEVAFDSIQVSKRHRSGLAMRFPRIKAIRREKTVADIDTLSFARTLTGQVQPTGSGGEVSDLKARQA
ncbi:MAG: ATP-dependent DNA ligase, partial [Verrucomicrobiia bacterium]